jgi:hypothetical protein
LANTPITHLPDDLVVGKWLDLSGTQITTLPDGLQVGGEIIGFVPPKPVELPKPPKPALVQGGKPLPQWNW